MRSRQASYLTSFLHSNGSAPDPAASSGRVSAQLFEVRTRD